MKSREKKWRNVSRATGVLLLAMFCACGPGVSDFNNAILLDQLINASVIPGDGVRPTLTATSPNDGNTAVFTNTSLSITFNEAMNAATLTADLNALCSAAIQLSSNDFINCVPMNGAPTAVNGNTVFSVKPAADLSANTVYKLRVTSAALDASGAPLSPTYTMTSGFTTGAGSDTTAPAISSTSPTDTAAGIALNAAISITFSETMSLGSITTNTANTSCSGSLQVSRDGFTTCVQMASTPAASNSDRTFTLTPSPALSAGTTYAIRVTTGARDLATNALAATFTTGTGFTTTGKLTFITAAPQNGNLGGIAGADGLCMGDANYPGTGTYKALVVLGTTRRASSTANAGDGQMDWVLLANTLYYRADGSTEIFTTNANRIFPFGTLTNSFGTGGPRFWTGLQSDWTNDATNHCLNWANNMGANFGQTGDQVSTNGSAIQTGTINCASNLRLLCVQQ